MRRFFSIYSQVFCQTNLGKWVFSLTLEPSIMTPNLLDHKRFKPLSKFPEIKSCPSKTKINWKKLNPYFMGDYKKTAIPKQMI